jgi:hypothetical protein
VILASEPSPASRRVTQLATTDSAKLIAFAPQDSGDGRVEADEADEADASSLSEADRPPSGTGQAGEPKPGAEQAGEAVVVTEAESSPAEGVSSEEPGGEQPSASTPRAATSVWGIVFSIVIAALCWGSYGPFLHIGQSKMDGSRLRPFSCVGLAYFFIAVAVPLVIIYTRSGDEGAWNLPGMSWSFAAGVLGAIGALGVIMAFNAGGKPFYVMPLVFGFAPVVNTFISLTETNTWSLTSVWFYSSLAVVIAGAVTVLTNAPKPQPKPPKPAHG